MLVAILISTCSQAFLQSAQQSVMLIQCVFPWSYCHPAQPNVMLVQYVPIELLSTSTYLTQCDVGTVCLPIELYCQPSTQCDVGPVCVSIAIVNLPQPRVILVRTLTELLSTFLTPV